MLGWFVVREEDEAREQTVSPDELIAKYAQAAPESRPTPVPLTGELPRATPGVASGGIDFAAVYRAASISSEEQERVEKARGLLSTLPTETPREVKKQIVEASLKAFGVPVEQIIEAGAQQIQALEAYIRHGEHETQGLLQQSNERIAQLTVEIEQIKQIMQQQVSAQQTLTRASNDEKLRVQAVLEFFGEEAIAKVVEDSPKLLTPEG